MSRPVRWARMRSDCEPGGPGRAGRAGPGRAGPGGRIRKGNAAFQSRLGSKPGGVDALIAFGFKEARARLTPAGVGADVQARMISTGTGIPEHHATGSVSAILAVQPHAVGLVAPGITRSPLMQGVEVARPPDLALTTWVGGRTAIRVKGAAVPISSGLLHMPELPPATD